MKRVVALFALLAVLGAVTGVWAANETQTDVVQMVRSRLSMFNGHVLSGCAVTVPSPGSLVIPAFACTANVKDGASLVPVTQDSLSITLPNTTGNHWIAVDMDRTRTVSGWTRVGTSHYLRQVSATRPADIAGVHILGMVTVSGGVIASAAPERAPLLDLYNLTGLIYAGNPPYNVRCDGTNEAAAIQAALDTGPVLLPPGLCNIGTTSLTINRSGQLLMGWVNDGGTTSTNDTIIRYTGTDFAIKSASSDLINRARFKEFTIDTNSTDGAKAFDFTNFSYSSWTRVNLIIKGNNTRGFYATGREPGQGPYFNRFEQCDIQMDNGIGGSPTAGSVGIFLDKLVVTDEASKGPNANTWNGGRISSGDRNIVVKSGFGNTFRDVIHELARIYSYQFGDGVATQTGTITSDGTANQLIDASKTWGSNSFAGGTVCITANVGAGQCRLMTSNTTGGTITLAENWRTLPKVAAPASTYAIFDRVASNNMIQGGWCEGDPASTAIRLEKGAYGLVDDIPKCDSVAAFRSEFLYKDSNVSRSIGRRDPIPFYFYQKNVGASQTSVALEVLGNDAADGSLPEYQLPFDGAIVRIQINANANRTAGTLTVTPTVNGTEQTLSARLDADVTQRDIQTQATQSEPMGAIGRRLGVKITTDAGWLPTTADILVTVWVLPL